LRSVKADYEGGVVLSQIDDLRELLEKSNLLVSLAALNNLDYIVDMTKRLKNVSKDKELGLDPVHRITQAITSLNDIVVSEFGITMVYILPQRRYNGKYLINNPEKLLKEKTLGNLSI
jgi:phage terminase large subunit-like protein